MKMHELMMAAKKIVKNNKGDYDVDIDTLEVNDNTRSVNSIKHRKPAGTKPAGTGKSKK